MTQAPPAAISPCGGRRCGSGAFVDILPIAVLIMPVQCGIYLVQAVFCMKMAVPGPLQMLAVAFGRIRYGIIMSGAA